MSFESLSEIDKFRLLFLQSGIFKSDDEFDPAIAGSLWNARYPKVEWGVCGANGCQDLTPDGERCLRHALRTGSLPSWKFSNGKLYMARNEELRENGNIHYPDEYVMYDQFVAEKRWGRIPNGFTIVHIDGNPFNSHWTNILILSKISATCVKERALTIDEAIRVDEVLHDFLFRKNEDEVFLYWCYTLNDIYKVTRIPKAKLREMIQNGKLNPHRFNQTARLIMQSRTLMKKCNIRPPINAYKPSAVVYELLGLPEISDKQDRVISILEELEKQNPGLKPIQLLEFACKKTDLIKIIGYDPRE